MRILEEEKIRDEVALALSEDRSEAIVLGCAGMVDLARDLTEEFQVPVIDGVTSAVKLVKALFLLVCKPANEMVMHFLERKLTWVVSKKINPVAKFLVLASILEFNGIKSFMS